MGEKVWGKKRKGKEKWKKSREFWSWDNYLEILSRNDEREKSEEIKKII